MAGSRILRSTFLEEALQLLEECEFFTEIERTGIPAPGALDCAQGTMHSLRGAASAAGFIQFATLAKEVETLLIRVRSDRMRPEALQALIAAYNHLYRMVLLLTEDMDSECADAPLLEEIRLLNQSIPHADELLLTDEEIGQLLALETAKFLQERSSASLCSFQETFTKLARAAEEVARTVGKEIRFKASGSHFTASPRMLALLTDPLHHLIRNAVDHGIEAPSERAALQKPAQGTITVEVRSENERLIVSCSDDGKGLHPDQLRVRAVARGFAASRDISDHDAIQLIFLPGFSTRDEVTALSGRGIGMDIVRANVLQMGGEILIESQPGRGTTFRIELPLRCDAEKENAA